MNNRGISLVELIAVIVIIGLLALITFPSITKMLSDFRTSTTEIQESSIIEGAKSYVADNVGITIFKTDEGIEEVTVKKLYDDGYIDGEFINRNTNKEYDLEKSKVIIEYSNNKYKYTVNLVDKE